MTTFEKGAQRPKGPVPLGLVVTAILAPANEPSCMKDLLALALRSNMATG